MLLTKAHFAQTKASCLISHRKKFIVTFLPFLPMIFLFYPYFSQSLRIPYIDGCNLLKKACMIMIECISMIMIECMSMNMFENK